MGTNTHCNVIQEFGHMLNNFTMVCRLGLQQFLNDNNTFSNYDFCLRQNKLLISKAFMQKKGPEIIDCKRCKSFPKTLHRTELYSFGKKEVNHSTM